KHPESSRNHAPAARRTERRSSYATPQQTKRPSSRNQADERGKGEKAYHNFRPKRITHPKHCAIHRACLGESEIVHQNAKTISFLLPFSARIRRLTPGGSPGILCGRAARR